MQTVLELSKYYRLSDGRYIHEDKIVTIDLDESKPTYGRFYNVLGQYQGLTNEEAKRFSINNRII